MSLKTKVRDFLSERAKSGNLAQYLLLKSRWALVRHNSRYSDFDFAQKLWRDKGQEMDFDHPKTFDEKLWYLKLSNRDPLLTVCSDKHMVRNYVTDCGYKDILKKEYGCFSSAKEIDFSTMPSPCYLKCNHASGMNWIYKREEKFNRRFFNWKFDFLLKQNPYWLSREWNYKNIPPRIVCEEVLSMKDGSDIPELQFFCFHGEPKLIMYNLGLADANGNHKAATRWVFDTNYTLLPVKTSMPTTDAPPAKPKNFNEMLECARRLSRPFPHVRVDLFNLDGRIVFNELTFYSGGGFVKLEPKEWQDRLGDWIDLSGYSIAEDAKADSRR